MDASAPLLEAPFDVIAAFSLLHLVSDVPGLLDAVFRQLRPGGLFLVKPVCLGDVNVGIRLFVRALRAVGIAPPITMLRKAEVSRALTEAGFDLIECRHFGKGKHNPFFVAQRPA